MKRDKSGVIAIIFIILAVIAIIATILIRNQMNKKEGTSLDIGAYSAQGITEAYLVEDKSGAATRYDIFVTVDGYKAPIESKISISGDKKTLQQVEILQQGETEELGAKIAESSFLSQFNGKELPVSLKGDENTAGTMEDADNQSEQGTDSSTGGLGEGVKRKDGVYYASGTRADNGYLSEVILTITNGEITEVIWEATDEEGNTKRVLSLNDKYVMTEDGLLWAEQADLLQAYVVEHQGLGGLNTNEEGKTDAVSGVSINISEFKEQVRDCLLQATGSETDEKDEDTGGGNDSEKNEELTGTVVDGVSGATISSKAVIHAIDVAYGFLQELE